MAEIEKIVKLGAGLPNFIFRKTFSKYFFFDNDICTSDCLINAVKHVIDMSFDCEVIANVFSCSDYQCLGILYSNDNWVEKINSFGLKMNELGNYGGLVILDNKGEWVVFQNSPIDEGVFAINTNKSLTSIRDIIYDNLIDCEIIKTWLEKKTERDISLVEQMGQAYLYNIVINYC